MNSLQILQQIFPGKAAVRLAVRAPALDLAPQTLRNWTSSGICPFPTKKAGGARVACLQDVANWLDGDIAAPPMPSVAVQPISMRRRGRPTKVAQVERARGAK